MKKLLLAFGLGLAGTACTAPVGVGEREVDPCSPLLDGAGRLDMEPVRELAC